MVVKFLRMNGIHVYNLSQGYRPGGPRHATTRQTKGLGDLYCLWPEHRLSWWVETKRLGGKQSPEQVIFQRVNSECGIEVVVGGLKEAVAHVERIRGVAPRS